ncbi:putative F-box/LRR-repeat protein 23 [Trifolium pratense]|nr:putative F-box/LRR-repeat protein 23 [Trifolium pratense]
MASCSNAAKEAEAESTKVPNWLELPRDITVNILGRLDTIDIVTNVCHVCPLWWNIFKDPLMWRSIHMTNFKRSSYINLSELVQICCYAVERSCGRLLDIDIKSFATDDLLQCIARNGSNLGSMRLVTCQRISEKGFSEAVRKLSRLEELDISLCNNLSKDALKVIGISCPLLKSLKFDRGWCASIRGADDSEALIISETMARLCRLDIQGNTLTDVGLVAILDKCPLLEYLDIQDCYNLSLSESLRKRCIEQIKNLQLPILDNFEDFDYEYDVNRDTNWFYMLDDSYYDNYDP